jgi:hypothetical protein
MVQKPSDLILKYKDNPRVEVADEKQLAAWRTLYGKVFDVVVGLEYQLDEDGKLVLDKDGQPVLLNEGQHFYFCAPDRMTLSLAESESRLFVHRFDEVIMQNCLICGKREVLEDEELFRSAGTELDRLVTYKLTLVKEV